MNIGSLPLQAELPVNSTNVGIAVLAKNLDTIDKAGQNLIQMMEQSVQPNLGTNIDYKV